MESINSLISRLGRWGVKVLPLAGIFLLTAAAFASGHMPGSAYQSDSQFHQEKYLNQCGGKIYNKCDEPKGPNQLTIFEEALDIAKKSGRDLVVVAGADWCGPCQILDRLMHAEKDWNEPFDKHFVLVKINGQKANVLSKYYFSEVKGFPTIYIFSVKKGKPVYQSMGGMPLSMSQWVDTLIASRNGVVKEIEAPEKIGDTRLSLLMRPIEFISGFGKSDTPISFTKDGDGSKKSQAQGYFNQGLSFLHSFQYVDAFRSFQMSERAMNSASANVGLAYALNELSKVSEGQEDYTLQESMKYLQRAQELFAKENNGELEGYERAWWTSVAAQVCASFIECSNRGIISQPLDQKQAWEKLAQEKGVTVDLKAIAGYKLSDKEILDEVLGLQPDHVGANHYRGHFAEDENNRGEALQFLEKFAFLAPKSPHAQHMYGHALSTQGRWEEAISQFQKAHRWHLEWMDQNEAGPLEDWNFVHNSMLYASALMISGQLDLAENVISMSCKNSDLLNKSSCLTTIQVNIMKGDYQEALRVFGYLGIDDEGMNHDFKALLKVFEDFRQGETKDAILGLEKLKKSKVVKYFFPQDLMQSLLSGANEEQMVSIIDEQLGRVVSGGAFDVWVYRAIPYLLVKQGLNGVGVSKAAQRIDDILKQKE